ncbi:TetR/AcrR family transcriptional regulator [Paenibacillus donghaensis]|uniref:TetR/AcrR family transcriptional regulator n=1 Tax=Paenibacillus donghaensis TaxID=414771 RepID=UPI001883D91C|nr:TetR/AcrR family transcriptional regulator [Paenibacillus donghaensis]MBE9913842.1 TetR/AcrR family transcriptional regulator [Paenibacillus donghaensis]
MNGFERRARQIKGKIKETTLNMLSTSSMKEIRIADIAREAGVSQVTIYNYFGSKEALIREIFLEFMESILDEFEAVVTGEAALKEKIEFIILQKKKNSHSFHPSVIAELMENDSEVRVMVQKNYEERSLPLVVELLTKSKANGEISNDISIDTVMLYLNMLYESSHRMLESIQYEEDQEKLIEEMVQVFFYGICGPQTQK